MAKTHRLRKFFPKRKKLPNQDTRFSKNRIPQKREFSAISNLVEWIPRKKTRDFARKKILRDIRNFSFFLYNFITIYSNAKYTTTMTE